MKGQIGIALTGLALVTLACETAGGIAGQEVSVTGQIDGMTFLRLNDGPELTQEQMEYLVTTKQYYTETIGCTPTLSSDVVVIPFRKLPKDVANYAGASGWSLLVKAGGVQLFTDELTVSSPSLYTKLKEMNIITSNRLTPVIFVDIENLEESGAHETAHSVCHQGTRVVYERALIPSSTLIPGEDVTIALSKDPNILIMHDDGGITTVITLKEIHAMILEITLNKQIRMKLGNDAIPELDITDFPSGAIDPYSRIFHNLVDSLNTNGVQVDHTIISALIRDSVTVQGSESLALIAQELHARNPHIPLMDIFSLLLEELVDGQKDMVKSD